MWMLWAMAAVMSSVMYHMASKTLSGAIQPVVYTGTVGGIIFLISLAYMLMQTTLNGVRYTWPQGNLLVWLVVGSAAGAAVDFANFMMYRSGAPVAYARTFLGAMVTVMLLLVGWLYFKEHLTWQQGVGVAFCMAGVGLIGFFRG